MSGPLLQALISVSDANSINQVSMKNLKYKTILLGVAIFLSACTDLEQINPNYPTEASFWKTKEDFYQGLIGAYDQLQSGEMYGGKIQQTYNLLSDEGFTGELGEPLNLATFTYDLGNEFVETLWYDLYTLIARSYEVIERLLREEKAAMCLVSKVSLGKLNSWLHWHILI